MTSRLCRAPIIVALLLLLGPAHADGRADWSFYAWQEIKLSACTATGTTLTCPPYHQKWDWKRNQWVDIAITIDLARGTFDLTQRLSDRDGYDDDDVCVTVLGLDAAGNNVLAHHQNWRMRHGDVTQESFTYRSSRLADLSTVHLGSKQCRQGAHQDDAIYDSVLAGIRP